METRTATGKSFHANGPATATTCMWSWNMLKKLFICKGFVSQTSWYKITWLYEIFTRHIRTFHPRQLDPAKPSQYPRRHQRADKNKKNYYNLSLTNFQELHILITITFFPTIFSFKPYLPREFVEVVWQVVYFTASKGSNPQLGYNVETINVM